MPILLVYATGYSYLEQSPPNGKISMKAVSWKLVKKLAEPDAGLSGHQVTIMNPADRSVIASGTTNESGLIEFELPPAPMPCSAPVMSRRQFKSKPGKPQNLN
jgi:hypothetical protein